MPGGGVGGGQFCVKPERRISSPSWSDWKYSVLTQNERAFPDECSCNTGAVADVAFMTSNWRHRTRGVTLVWLLFIPPHLWRQTCSFWFKSPDSISGTLVRQTDFDVTIGKCLVSDRIQHALFSSDTRHCPMRKSNIAPIQQLIGSDAVVHRGLGRKSLGTGIGRKKEHVSGRWVGSWANWWTW